MTEEEVRRLAEQVADRAVNRTLSALGIDLRSVQDVQADLHWLRSARRGSEEMGRYVKRSAIGVVVPFAIWLLYEGIRNYLAGGAN